MDELMIEEEISIKLVDRLLERLYNLGYIDCFESEGLRKRLYEDAELVLSEFFDD